MENERSKQKFSRYFMSVTVFYNKKNEKIKIDFGI